MNRIPFSTQQPDARVVSLLFKLQRIVLGTIAMLASLTLLAWLMPPLGRTMPDVWMLMNPNTLGCALLGALSMTLAQPTRSTRSINLSRIFAVMITVVAASCLIEDFTREPVPAHALGVGHALQAPERMSPSLALGYLMIGLTLCWLRRIKGIRAVLADLLTITVSMLMLVLTSGYLFDSGRTLGDMAHRRLSPEELIILLCLTFAVFTRRAEFGAFSILLETGIGGETARMAAPMAIGLPLLMGLVEIGGVSSGLMPPAYATAVIASVLSMVAFCLVLVLARRTAGMEHEINELSLRDTLTGLYNRRSFFLLAEQAMRQTRRNAEPFSLLLIDVDGVRQANEAMAPETGSELLQRMGTLMVQNFREADVTARLSGSEFVVAGKASSSEIAVATYRLLQMTTIANERQPQRTPLKFSFGHVSCDHSVPFTVEALIAKANGVLCEGRRSNNPSTSMRGVPTLVPTMRPVPVAAMQERH